MTKLETKKANLIDIKTSMYIFLSLFPFFFSFIFYYIKKMTESSTLPKMQYVRFGNTGLRVSFYPFLITSDTKKKKLDLPIYFFTR